MSEGVQLVLVPAIVSLVIAVVGVYGVRYTARASTKAKAEEVAAAKAKDAETAGIEKARVDGEAYVHAREALLDTIADLRKDVAQLRTAQGEDRHAHQEQMAAMVAEHRKQIYELREERRDHDVLLNARLTELESQRTGDRRRIAELEAAHTSDGRRIAALVAYIRKLLAQLDEHEIPPDPAPPGLMFD